MLKNVTAFLFILISGLVFAQQQWNVRFYHETEGQEAVIYADNPEIMPMSAQLSYTLQNMKSTLPSGTTVVLPPLSEKTEIMRLTKIKQNASNRFSYQTLINFGNVLLEEYDEDHLYTLPFENGKTQLIFQGYRGKLSHHNADALDFDLNVGDKVFAARGGLVVEAVENNTRNCPDISCAKFNNYILILHSDGTFAEYSHLKHNGSEVLKGDVVEQGQFIGYSGNTGYSTGPHLHFSVFINRIDGKRDYLKTKFRTAEFPEGELLKEKQKYRRDY